MVLFDLPVIEPKERKAATDFRNFLKDNGFEMAQFSVYIRYTSGKEAVEALFNVKVKAVNTTITKGKVKRFRGQIGTRKDVKKAYVTLEEGNTIDVSTGL